MSHTNKTTHYDFPQFVGTDQPAWLTDINGAFSSIDSEIYAREQATTRNTGDITQLIADINTLSTDVENAKQDVANLTGRVATVETRQDDVDATLSQYDTQITTLTNQVTNLTPNTLNVVLLANGWQSNGTYTITNQLLTSDKKVVMTYPINTSDSDYQRLSNANIRQYQQTGNSLVIKALGEIPTTDLTIILEVTGG